ncbi:hypothetical protein AOLI_G00046900 [Acnodon oligacanthus]
MVAMNTGSVLSSVAVTSCEWLPADLSEAPPQPDAATPNIHQLLVLCYCGLHAAPSTAHIGASSAVLKVTDSCEEPSVPSSSTVKLPCDLLLRLNVE